MTRRLGLIGVACWLILATPTVGQNRSKSPRRTSNHIHVVDDAGATVVNYQKMWHTEDDGYSHWSQGPALMGLAGRANVIDVLVRADGYATTVRRFEGDELKNLRSGKATIILKRGTEVRLRLNVPGGMSVPENFLPQLYFREFASRVRMMWQPVNLRSSSTAPDFDMLNVSRVTEQLYSFRLSPDSKPFHVAFNHPGWLRFYEAGPFTELDVKDGVLAIDVPPPAKLRVSLQAKSPALDELPFVDAQLDIHWAPPDRDDLFYSCTWDEKIRPGQTREFFDLGPGSFNIYLRTNPRKGISTLEGTQINPGRFATMQPASLSPGKTCAKQINWKPFDPESKHGDGRARLSLLRVNGAPAAGARVKINWFDGHYGNISIFEGVVPEDGMVHLNNISTSVPHDAPFGPYRVELDGDSVGWFQVDSSSEPQEFAFRMVPKVGDQAPDIEIVDALTGNAQPLSSLRGQVVLIEFWATWCGPCQPAMQKLNALASETPTWWNQVAVVPINVDVKRERSTEHVARRGWTALDHYWSPPGRNNNSQAENAFVVNGIPTAILLKPDGTIAWRGHPLAKYSGGIGLSQRIENLLRDN